jgi:hypothetical protein
MDVRQARPTDAPLVLALALDEHTHLVTDSDRPGAASLLRTASSALLPLAVPGRTWVAHSRSTAAMLEARPRRYVIGWDVCRLAARGQADEVVSAVVSAAVCHLQSRGIPRLFARCAEDRQEVLSRLEFRPIAREFVLAGSGTGEGGDNLPSGSRYRMPQDAWPLHLLATDVTPPLVRHLEGSTSVDWNERKNSREIIVEREGRIVAWIGWRVRATHGVRPVAMIVHDEHAETGLELLMHALRQAPAGTRFRARIREYQPEALQAFLDAGFTIIATEVVMVRHGRLQPALARKRVAVARIPSMPVAPLHLGAETASIVTEPIRLPEKEERL